MSFWKWSRTASNNATADSSVNWTEGQAPSSVNDSARAMKAVAKDFNLQITLATPRGEYLSGTKLQIQNGSGRTTRPSSHFSPGPCTAVSGTIFRVKPDGSR